MPKHILKGGSANDRQISRKYLSRWANLSRKTNSNHIISLILGNFFIQNENKFGY